MTDAEPPATVATPDPDAPGPLSPREFCALQRTLLGGMAMRKKRNLKMGPVQAIKVDLLSWLEAHDPTAEAFPGAVAEAVVTLGQGGASGPFQAVASDLLMDWQMACTSDAFVAWLREAASKGERAASDAATARARG